MNRTLAYIIAFGTATYTLTLTIQAAQDDTPGLSKDLIFEEGPLQEPEPDADQESSEIVGARGITYETRWIDGTPYQIGTDGSFEVWVTLETDPDKSKLRSKDFRATLQIANLSMERVTFDPSRIRLESIRQRKKGIRKVPVYGFSADEYKEALKSRVRSTLFWGGFLKRLGDQPGPTTSQVEVDFYDEYGFQYGSASGTITTPPSSSERAAANARTNAYIRSVRLNLNAGIESISGQLMRTYTLDSDMYYVGDIYFRKTRGDQYSMLIPVGWSEFEFTFLIDVPSREETPPDCLESGWASGCVHN